MFNNRTDDSHYGKPEVIDALVKMGADWAARETLPNPPVSIGHISRRLGGTFPPHNTHRTGDDIDIRPMRKDGMNERVTWMDTNYSRALTRDMIKAIRANMPITSILFNDPVLIRERLCQQYPRHDDHLHVNVGVFPQHQTLRLGSKGQDVRLLQEKLHIKITGVFDADTEHAVREFQAHRGLIVDGIVGRNTRAKMENE